MGWWMWGSFHPPQTSSTVHLKFHFEKGTYTVHTWGKVDMKEDSVQFPLLNFWSETKCEDNLLQSQKIHSTSENKLFVNRKQSAKLTSEFID